LEATWLLTGVAIFISISFIVSPCVDFSCHATYYVYFIIF